MLRILSLILSACGFAVAGNPPATVPTQRFSIRLVIQDITPNVDHELLPALNDATRESIAVSKSVLFSEADTEHVELMQVDGTSVGVMLTLTEDAGKRMTEFSVRHVGRELAIVLDGVVLTAPRIATELGRHVAIDLGRNPEVAPQRAGELYRALTREAPTTRP